MANVRNADVRVLHLLGSLGNGGRESLLLDIIRNTGDDVEYAVGCFRNDGAVDDDFEALGAPVTCFDASSQRDLGALWRLLRFCWTEQFDVIHAHGPLAQIPARTIGRLCGIDEVVSTHHGVEAMFPTSVLRVERATRPLDSATVAVSHGVRHSFLGDSDPEQWVTIQNGIDVEAFAAEVEAANPAPIRSEYGVGEDEVVFLNIGRYVAEKSQEDLVPATERVVEAGVDAHTFVVGGRGAGESIVREHVTDSEVSERVHVTGPVESIHEYYALADAFVSSSTEEGLPIVQLEAMAAGLPVVATDIPGVRELVVDGETGVLVPPESPRELAEGMLDVADAGVRERLGSAGHDRVASEFSVEETTDSYSSLYKRLAANGEVPDEF